MKCLPALRSGQAGWLFPLSVPAAEFLAAFLMKFSASKRRMFRGTVSSLRSSLPLHSSSQLHSGSQLYSGSQLHSGFDALLAEGDGSEHDPWVARAVALLRSDWSLRWYVALRWCADRPIDEELQAERILPSVKVFGDATAVSPQVSLNELAYWLIQNACEWFGNGDLRLFAAQVQSRLSPKWYENWQQAADRFRIAQGSENTRAEHRVLCELLEASGDSLPVAWKSIWPEILDGPYELDGLHEDEEFEGPGVVDEERVCLAEVGNRNVVPQPDGEATCVEFLGYGQAMVDLDECARKQSELESYRSRFEACVHDEKMASLRQLAYGLSHELNNPLAAIRTRAELLQRNSHRESDRDSANQLQKIVDSAMRAHEMIADMMYFAKPPRLQYRHEDAIRLTAEVVDEYRQACEEASIEFRFSIRDQSIGCWGDRLQLAGAVRALIRNAIEAVGHSGAICVSVRKSGRQVQWMVSDSGGGMSPEARRHAFDPYYSGREAGRGLGLGLCRVYRVAQSHGGKASVVDMANLGMVGCQVRFWIPRQRPRPDGGSTS